jgi:hypothetical protein
MRVSSSFRRAILLAVCLGGLGPVAAHAQKPPKKERNRISREELVQAAERYSILYDAIRNLRPHFLQVNARGVRTTGIGQGGTGPGSTPLAGAGGSYAQDAKPTVYVDGTRSGDPDILKNLSTNAVAEVRYLTPTEAENELGPRNEGGAILVKLAKP